MMCVFWCRWVVRKAHDHLLVGHSKEVTAMECTDGTRWQSSTEYRELTEVKSRRNHAQSERDRDRDWDRDMD